ncbi:MAG: gliding motility-associated C-terminal domain-containing protein [Chitinophagales bacterium]
MPKHPLLFSIFFIIIFPLHSQTNLVPNPGFEDYSSCPTSYSGVSSGNVTDWFAPTFGSSDYFHSCASDASTVNMPDTYWWGYSPSHFCEGMVGVFTYEDGFGYREYVTAQFTEPLEADVTYYVEFWVTTSFFSGTGYDFIVATDEVGAFISDFIPDVTGFDYVIEETPQIENIEGNYLNDSATWYNISGLYTAVGGEEYITIGNFKNDDETDYVIMYDVDPSGEILSGYIFIDDVIVTEYTGPVSDPTEPGDVILCEGEDVDLTAPYGAVDYLWSTGETTQSINVDEEGVYTVVIDLECEILEYTFNVYVSPSVNTSSFTEIELCTTEFPILLIGEPGYTTYDWTTGEFNDTITVTEGGLYVVDAANICNIQTDSFFVDALDPSEIAIFLGNDTLICTNETWEMVLNAENEFETYEWSTGETSASITVIEPGVYSVTAENICGNWFDEIEIEAGTVLFKPDLGPNLVLCEGEGFTEAILTAQEQECSYYWSTGETTQSISVTVPGTYWVECTNICGKVKDSVVVQLCTYIYIPNAFTPNGDGINDFLSPVYYLNVELISFEVYNRWGELMFTTNDITTGWDGTFNDEAMPMETYVYIVRYNEFGYIAKKQGSVTLVR